METHGWFVCSVILMVMVALATNRVAVDVAMLTALTVLLVGDVLFGGGVLSVQDAAAGFANPALILIGSLFVVAAGLERTGGLEKVARFVLGHPKTQAGAVARLTFPVALMSGVMNNTPIVAMYLAIVHDWAKRLRMSASKLYMPLSFAAILGGKLTLFGTASNMIVMALYHDHVSKLDPSEGALYQLSQREEFWGIALLGVPTTIAGLVFMVVAAPWIIPARRPVESESSDPRRFHIEMQVGTAIHGQTVQQAGLRQLQGLFLAHIERDGETRVAGRHLRLEEGDRLGFVGALESVLDLRKIRGLVPVDDDKMRSDHGTVLVEAVISARSTLVGRTVRGSNFRARYNAAIWAVHRHGEQLTGKIGEIRLRPGDTLLLEARPGGASALKNNPDFYLASAVQASEGIRHDRANVALLILLFVVLAITVFDVAAPVAALVGAGMTVATRCIRSGVARAAINWQVLMVIGSAWSLGTAMDNTGVAQYLAEGVVGLFHDASAPMMILILFLVTAGFAQLITNNGAAVLMFPIAMRVAHEFAIHPHAVLFTLMVAAGSTFLSPISYQTNLMIYGPGGYRFMDFVRLGAPLTLLLAVICALVAPFAY
jgi:di/tricarboxylate transporter